NSLSAPAAPATTVEEAPAPSPAVSSLPEPPSAMAAAAAASAAKSSEDKPVAATATTAAPGLRKLKSTVKIPSSLQGARQMAASSAAEALEKATPEQKEQQTAASLPDQEYSREQFMASWKLYG